jgi:hypothetical protein
MNWPSAALVVGKWVRGVREHADRGAQPQFPAGQWVLRSDTWRRCSSTAARGAAFPAVLLPFRRCPVGVLMAVAIRCVVPGSAVSSTIVIRVTPLLPLVNVFISAASRPGTCGCRAGAEHLDDGC